MGFIKKGPFVRSENSTRRRASTEAGRLENAGLEPRDPPYDLQVSHVIGSQNGQELKSWVATVVIESNRRYSNDSRMVTLNAIVNILIEQLGDGGVIVLPAGWFSAGQEKARVMYNWLERPLRDALTECGNEVVVCVGVDGSVFECQRDQMAVAVSKHGILAIARKVFAAPSERGRIDLATNYLCEEDGKSRIFTCGCRRFFLAVCYDSFGVKRNRMRNPGVDVMITLVHGFNPKGQGGSGDVYFAKYGFAASSKEWNCPVYGAAVFSERSIPTAWPSGVLWNQATMKTQFWCYAHNPVKPAVTFYYPNEEGRALITVYDQSGA
jgi:hypothetical protein